MLCSYPVSVFIFSGAGLSAESGLGTFRDQGGLWEKADPAVVCSADSMEKHPAEVYRFYNERWAQFSRAIPNAAHYALANLEKWASGKMNLHLVTQNIDSLLENAGAQTVIHMHGSLAESRCTASGKVFPFDGRYSLQKVCSCCSPGHLLRPNVVFFGEVPQHLDVIGEQLKHCDVFCSIGTSGAVMPAGGFAKRAALCGCRHLIEINKDAPVNASDFNVHLRGCATDWVPRLTKAVKAYVKGNEKAFEELERCAECAGKDAGDEEDWF